MRQLVGVLLLVCVYALLSVSLVDCLPSVPSFCRQFIDETQAAANSTDDDDDDDDVDYEESEDANGSEEEEEEKEDAEEEEEESDDDIDDADDVMQIAAEEIDMLNMIIEFMAYVFTCIIVKHNSTIPIPGNSRDFFPVFVDN